MKKHGLSIGLERVDDTFFVSMKVVGQLTHEDYKIITPLLESALQGVESPKIDLLMDATELEGWVLRAAWDDLKLGLKHGKSFERIAIVGNQRWLEVSAKVGSWFMSGKVKYFEDMAEATAWVSRA
ncbi:MAG: STAS/SEC14 domain-containing protein [Lysobacteraceae bacterium]|nr:MAG: STAS/SEC14 domain-containing protein [Xanthomonadaceae bacterium]